MLFNAALIIYNSIGEYEMRPDAALGLMLWLRTLVGGGVERGRASASNSAPSTCSRPNLARVDPYGECNLDARAAVSSEPVRRQRMSGCEKALAPLQMDGLYSAIASAAAGASDLATSAASAASRTAAQSTASTPTAMESIIQTGAASAAAALFGSTDAVTPPKTLALGAAWRDALCPAHRERTDLPGGARSEGLAMIVAACARIESTSAPRRAALQRLVRLAASE